MRKGVNHLEPKLRAKAGGLRQRGLVLLATVEGDIHDIGKNIVALMLKNHGYKIIDLGKDVSAESIIQTMRKMKPDVVGLSALMTTTMVNMKNVIEQGGQGGPCRPIPVGGGCGDPGLCRFDRGGLCQRRCRSGQGRGKTDEKIILKLKSFFA